MKKALALVAVLASVFGTGCLQMRQASINSAADEQIAALDAECKKDMTDWCVMQYQMVESRRSQALADATVQHALAAQQLQRSFSRR